MNMKQSDTVACANAPTRPFHGRYTAEGPFAEIERFLDRANEFIDSSPLLGMESAICYLDGGQQLDGLEPTFTAFVDLPISAFEPFHRFVTAD